MNAKMINNLVQSAITLLWAIDSLREQGFEPSTDLESALQEALKRQNKYEPLIEWMGMDG